MSYIEKEKLIEADIASIENRVRHAFNQGYDLGFKDGKKRAKPQEPQSFEWCDTCKEYDQENHCCHRWTKVIRNTVEEMKQGGVITLLITPYINRQATIEKFSWGLKDGTGDIYYTIETKRYRKPTTSKGSGRTTKKPKKRTVTVKKGDTLYGIAKKYDTVGTKTLV